MPFIVSIYAANETVAGDCLPDFFDTREEAERAAQIEIQRVASIPLADRHPQIDWAVRYTIEPETPTMTLTLSRDDAALLLMLVEHAAEDVLPDVSDTVESLIDRLKALIENA